MAIKQVVDPWKRHLTRKGLISKSAIQRTVDTIVRKFQPETIHLFGSYAYGRPTPLSDLDLLVVMPTRDELSKAARIHLAVDPPFSLDVIVRTPRSLAWRLKEGDWFLREVIGQGKLLYEKSDASLDTKGRRGLVGRAEAGKGKAPLA